MTISRPLPLDQLQAAFGRAEQLMIAGRLSEARAAALEVARHLPREPAVLRLFATIARRQGDHHAALGAYEAALAVAPRDGSTRLDYGSLLSLVGRHDEAVDQYRTLLALEPGNARARTWMGVAMERGGRFDEAIDVLEALVAERPGDADAWQALAAALRGAGDGIRAAVALNRVLALKPGETTTLRAVAGLTAERGLDARPAYQAVLAKVPDDPAARLGLAVAQASMGDADAALANAEAVTRVSPHWVDGQAALARLRWQFRGPEGFARGFEDALAANPREGALWGAYLRALARAGWTEAVYEQASRARRHVGASATIDMVEARAASEVGDRERADRLFEPLLALAMPEAHLLALPHWLKTSRPDRAAALAEPMIGGPHAGLAVPHLGTAWRLLGDSRAEWLDRPELVGEVRLDLDLDALADALRGLHRARHAPLDQSLREGTQTEGALFMREEPAICGLRDAALAAADCYVAALPPPEPGHPFLSLPRGAMRFSGSWSVRLTDSGFHVAHVHPQGRISSAFYVALPDTVGRDDARDGWLVLGEPPATLGLDLPPIAEVRPEPGLLALFPSTMWHGTRPFAAGERLTAAFDLVPRR